MLKNFLLLIFHYFYLNKTLEWTIFCIALLLISKDKGYFVHHRHLKATWCRSACVKLTRRHLPDFEEYAAFMFQQKHGKFPALFT